MATEQELIQALRKADAAGDVPAAQAIARRIAAMREGAVNSAITPPRVTSRKLSPSELAHKRAYAPNSPLSPSGWENFAAGAGKAVYDTGRGIGQLTGLLSQEDIDAAREQDQALSADTAGQWGNVTGFLAQMVGPGVLAKGTQSVAQGANMARTANAAGMVGRAALPTTFAGNVGQGAALGFIQPVATGESRLANTAMGAGGAAVGYAIPGMIRGARATLWDPLTDAGNDRIVGNTLRRFANDPAALANPAQATVPGLQYTLAEATLDPGIASLERAAMADPKVAGALAMRQQTNNLSRVQAIEGIAGKKGDIAAAVKARSQATSPLYEAATKLPVLIDDELKSIMRRPSVLSGLKKARRLAAEQGIDLPKSPDLIGSQHLQYVDQALGDMVSASKKPTEKRLILKTQQDLRKWMEAQMPDYLAAQQQFAAMSKPIDQMKIGRRILKEGAPSTYDPVTGTPILRSDTTLRMLQDLDTTAQRATKFRGATADVLTSQQRKTLEGVADSLTRKQLAQTAGKPVGSNTMQNLYSQNLMSQFGLPDAFSNAGLIGRLGTILDTGMKVAGVPERLQGRLAEALANPQQAQAILAKLPSKDREILQRAISSVGGRTLAVGQD